MKFLRFLSILGTVLLAVPLFAEEPGAVVTSLQQTTVDNTAALKLSIAENPSFPEVIPITAPGLTNVYQLSPVLYRGAQPTPQGYRTLADMGIKTIISFRTKKPDKKLLKKLGFTYYHIPINTFRFNDKHARKFLKILSHARGPVYIHCYHGSDRTGTMVALYRLTHDNWSREQALSEMQDKRFGFHSMFSNLVKYIQKVKLEKIQPKDHQSAEGK